MDYSFLSFLNSRLISHRKAMEDRQIIDDDRIESLEHHVKEASETATEAERRYDEVGCLPARYWPPELGRQQEICVELT